MPVPTVDARMVAMRLPSAVFPEEGSEWTAGSHGTNLSVRVPQDRYYQKEVRRDALLGSCMPITSVEG